MGSVELCGAQDESNAPVGPANEDADDAASVMTPTQREGPKDLLLRPFRSYYDPNKLGCARGIWHNIDTGDAPPVQQRYQSYNPRLEGETREELTGRLKLALVEPSDYCSPLLHPKKTGEKKNGKLRWVVDFRKLNA